MPSRDLDKAADFGALSPQVHFDLSVARRWMGLKNKELGRLLGEAYATDAIKHELLVACLDEFGRKALHSIGYYQDLFGHLCSRGATRNDIYALVERRLLVIQRVPSDRRVALVAPTVRLTSWASEAVPRLESTLWRLFIAREDMLSRHPSGNPT